MIKIDEEIKTDLDIGKVPEEWGSGLMRIYDACTEENVKIEFKELKSGFLMVFQRKSGWGVEKGVEKGVERFSENEKILLELIQKNPHIGKAEMGVKGKLTKKTVEYNVESLKKKGILRRIGPAKGGYWVAVK